MTGSQRQVKDPATKQSAAGAAAVPEDDGRGAWVLVLPGLATFAVTMWGIGSASFWRDEAATLSAMRRPLAELVRMLVHVDAVHGAYCLLMWPLAHVAGMSELVLRLPSAAAMAGAACGVAACGRRLGCWQAGLCAGLVFAALPMTSRYGQEARSYALVTAAVVLASYLLVRVIATPGRRWLVGYALSLAAVGLLNIFGLLIVPAHAVTLAAARRRGPARPGRPRGMARAGGPDEHNRRGWQVIHRIPFATAARLDNLPKSAVGQSPHGWVGLVRDRSARSAAPGADGLHSSDGGHVDGGHGPLRADGGLSPDGGRDRAGLGFRDPGSRDPGAGMVGGWLAAVAAAGVAVAPAAVFAWRERSQFAWLQRHKPGWPQVYALVTGLTGSTVLIALIAALGVLGALRGGRRDHGRSAGLRLSWLSGPWLIIPPALLFAVSQLDPAYQLRYLVFCVPAVAILAGAGLAALSRYLRIATLVLLALLALPTQQAIRQPAGHGDNIRAAADVLRAQALTADAVVYDDPGTRTDSYAYSYGFTRLHDISMLQTPAEAGNLGGTQASPPLLASRLTQAGRVWLVDVGPPAKVPAIIAAMHFRFVRVWRINAMTLWLYSRDTPGHGRSGPPA